ncbi:hypothetical protein JCM9957A_31580 [Kineosporia succinea]
MGQADAGRGEAGADTGRGEAGAVAEAVWGKARPAVGEVRSERALAGAGLGADRHSVYTAHGTPHTAHRT